MNFCPECGTDLRTNQNAKFCFSCGNKLAPKENVSLSHIEKYDFVETNNSDDDFDYFDFPEEGYFQDFMLEVMEYIALNDNLSNQEISIKYFEKGEEFLSKYGLFFKKSSGDTFFTLWRSEIDYSIEIDFPYQESLLRGSDEFLTNNDFEFATRCFRASLFFNPSQPFAHFGMFICYHIVSDYKMANESFVCYVEGLKDLYGLKDERTVIAAELCYRYYSLNKTEQMSDNVKVINISEELPNWIHNLGMPI